MKSAVFIGHDDIFGLDHEKLEEAIEECIQKGVTQFYSGGQGGFDRAAARAVFQRKRENEKIKNVLVIPYLHFKVFDASLFDEILFPEELETCHYKAAILKRNRYMVDQSDVAVCFVRYSWGKSAKTHAYALKKRMHIISLV